jgi:hypothetical protein
MDLSLSPGRDSVLISWTALAVGSTYQVVRATNADFTGPLNYIYEGPWAPSVTDRDPATLLPGVVYYYRVRASLPDGTRARSAPTATTLTGMTPLVALPRDGGWDLAWTGGQAGYTLMVNGSPTVSVSSTTYFFTPAAPGVYVLAIRDALGYLGGSVTVTSAGYVAPLAQPSVTSSAGVYQLDWSGGTEPYTVLVDGASTAIASVPTYLFDPAEGTYSIVVRDADGARTVPIDVVKSAEGTAASQPTVSPQGYVEGEFLGKGGTDSTDSSGTASAPPDGSASPTPPANAESGDGDGSSAPATPQSLKASAKGGRAVISWTADGDLHYEVQQATHSGFSSPTDAWSGSGGNADIGSFEAGDVVWFRVRVRGGPDGEPSNWSAGVRVDFPMDEEAPNQPTNPEKDARVPEKDEPSPMPEKATPPPSVPEPPVDDPKPVTETPKPEPPAKETVPADPPADAVPAE